MHHRLNMGYTIKAQVQELVYCIFILVPLSQALKGPKLEILGSMQGFYTNHTYTGW
jgi:hypothetical protein